MKFIHYLAWWDSLQAANTYSLSIFYSSSEDIIHLAQNSPCGSAWMVEAEPEAMREN